MGFTNIKASKHSIAMRKPLHGVGINDADYITSLKIGGKCPYYRTWQNMISRCYYKPYSEERPTYLEAKVCDEWLLFSNFRKWMTTQEWEGKCLDKDIFVIGNKTYSPDYCIFVSQEINSLLNKREASRGKYPQGVYYNKLNRKFHAQCSVAGKKKHIGFFTEIEEAEKAYIKFKADLIRALASSQSDQKLSSGLIKQADALEGGVS